MPHLATVPMHGTMHWYCRWGMGYVMKKSSYEQSTMEVIKRETFNKDSLGELCAVFSYTVAVTCLFWLTYTHAVIATNITPTYLMIISDVH